ncbi:FHAD1 [Branchiostoma lanceolatum]|uniref:FHAD1 protein n=1 Tax=Branchiostoma lanceolatum TaxID=7740 RepID=A0A8J9YNK0_BRALA|nr:FHAD1 [Branchiostoma lanceolatum]
MKGFLKSQEGVVSLGPKITTVGRENCDLAIQTQSVERQHAVIEYSDVENCFVLQDLNTVQGTYVNDCRIQNAAVRLAPGDMIQFGFGGMPYELVVEDAPQYQHRVSQSRVYYPPVQQRPAWSAPITILQTSPVPGSSTQLPYLPATTSTTPSFAWAGSGSPVLPHPPQKSRPLSAGARRGSFGASLSDPNTPKSSPPMPHRTISGSWVGRNGVSGSPTPDISPALLQDKEQKILRMGDEIGRLAVFEGECRRKDAIIESLRNEVSQLHTELRKAKESGQGDAVVTQKLLLLENEVEGRKSEVKALKDQLSHISSGMGSTSTLHSELSEKEREIGRLITENGKLRKDYSMTQGLVTSLQRDLSNKEVAINKLKAETDKLRKDVKDKDVQLAAMSAKFSRIRETKNFEEALTAKEKELATLRVKLRNSEKKAKDGDVTSKTLKDELDRVKILLSEEKENAKTCRAQMEHAKAQFLDMQRSERLLRVDLEQAQARLDRFRSRIIQVTYSAPGIASPDEEVDDNQVIDQMRNIIQDRTQFQNKVRDMKDQLKLAEESQKESQQSAKALRQHLSEAECRMRDKGRSANMLKQELRVLQSLSVDDNVQWVKDAALNLFNAELSWQQEIESALEKAGCNVKLSDEASAKHIDNLCKKLEAELKEMEKMRSHIRDLEAHHKGDLSERLSELRMQHQQDLADAIAKVRLEDEEKLRKALDELREAEAERRAQVVLAERQKLDEANNNMEELRVSFLKRQEEEKETRAAAQEALDKLEDYKQLEAKLRQEIEDLEQRNKLEQKTLREDLEDRRRGLSQETDTLREQVKQHALTIVAMEERLLATSKQLKEAEGQKVDLQRKLEEAQQKPKVPPKPVNIPPSQHDIFALEQLVALLRREVADCKQQIKVKEDVIEGLRKDLAGANARLTDMAGELSEHQKQELERNRNLVRDQELDLAKLRQQLAKMSELVDKQSGELQKANAEIRNQKQAVSSKSALALSKEEELDRMRTELQAKIDSMDRQISSQEEEGKIANELQAMGAQCRGERHEQVIGRQREALSELRARIKALEQVRPPIPTHEQALQQVVLLKKELAEMRAKQAMAEDMHFNSTTRLEGEVQGVRGMASVASSDAAVERSARIEMEEAMDMSERTYLELAKRMANELELNELDGLKSMAHLPRDERDRLAKARQKAIELLASRIRVLHQRIERKDELLNGYEKDMSKLRQAEGFAQQRAAEAASFMREAQEKSDETRYLRESLQRTREQLDSEKRLNTAIKQRKTFHLEEATVQSQAWPKHRCPPEDIHGRADAKMKSQKDKLRRKNYEIETLKSQLDSKEQQLCDTTTRLANIESSLGFDNRELE